MIIFKGKSSNVYTLYFIKESFNWNWLKDHRQWRQSLQLDKWCMCAVPGIGRGTRGKGLNWKQLWWWWHFLMFCLLVGGLVTMRAQSWKPWGTLLLQAPSDFSWFLKITKTPIWSFLFKEPGHWWQQWRLRTALPPTCLLSANYYLSIPVHLTPSTPALTLIWAWGSCLMLVEGTRQHSNNDRPCPSILLSSAAKLLAMMEELVVHELRGWVTTHWGVWEVDAVRHLVWFCISSLECIACWRLDFCERGGFRSINHFLHDLWVEDLQDLHAMMNMKYIISIQVARIVFLAAWSIHLIHIPSSYQPPDIYPNLPKSQSLDNSESWASVYVLIKKGVFYWFHPDSMELVPPNRLKSS